MITPGLWTAQKTTKGWYVRRTYAGLDHAVCKVLKVHGLHRLLDREQEVESNARAIALVPRLLQVLEQAVEVMDVGPEGYGGELEPLDVLNEARELLALVQGEGVQP